MMEQFLIKFSIKSVDFFFFPSSLKKCLRRERRMWQILLVLVTPPGQRFPLRSNPPPRLGPRQPSLCFNDNIYQQLDSCSSQLLLHISWWTSATMKMCHSIIAPTGKVMFTLGGSRFLQAAVQARSQLIGWPQEVGFLRCERKTSTSEEERVVEVN